MAKIKPNIKKALEENLSTVKGDFGCLLSSGLDSHAVLFSLLELDKKVTVYSFTLDDRESRDFVAARNTAKAYGLPFKPIYLPTDLKTVKKLLLKTVNEIGANSKAAIECIWALHQGVDAIKEKNIVSGLAADLYFVLSKKGCMHYKDCPDEYTIPRWESVMGNTSQTHKLREYAKTQGKVWQSPWLGRNMLNQFKGTTWDERNKPKQKNPIRVQYADYLEHVKTYNHTDLQLGDSGIAEQFERLLKDPTWNQWNFKSLTGIYNKILSGHITG